MQDMIPNLKWKKCLMLNGSPFMYKNDSSNLPVCPAIYRWRFENPIGEIKKVYLGEAQNLKNRIEGYKNIGRPELKKEFEGWSRELIYLDTLEIGNFKINEKPYSAKSLYSDCTRKLFENIMLYQELGQGYKILNYGYE